MSSLLAVATVHRTRGRVTSALASLALAATFVGFGFARKQQRFEQRQDARSGLAP